MRPMRRNDREMDEEFGLSVIDKAEYGVIGLWDDEGPYTIPITIIRDENTLYFHSARSGRKVDIFEKEPEVSVNFVTDVKVPHLYTQEELREIVKKGKILEVVSRVYTTEFASCIITGKVQKVEDEEEQIKALEILCKEYTPESLEFFPYAVERSLKLLHIYKIQMETIRAKRKKYDEDGVEIKGNLFKKKDD